LLAEGIRNVVVFARDVYAQELYALTSAQQPLNHTVYLCCTTRPGCERFRHSIAARKTHQVRDVW
jgi:hypothetical protein